jgi:hypothetical protein
MSAGLAAVPTQGAYMSTLPAIDPALARRHLIALARGDGYYELRALRRQADDSMVPGGSFWLPVNGGRSAQIDRALQWANRQYQGGAEVFVGYNPRITPTGSKKEHVGAVLACYADLDLHGQRLDEAQAALAEAPAPPSLLVHSGYGLHPIWFLAPSADKVRWLQVQRGIATAFAAYAPDSAVVSDEARVLRLVPYPNRKYGDCIPTAIVAQSGTVYTLAQLALVYPAPASEPHGVGRPPTIVTTNRVPLGLQRYAEAGLKHGERNKGAFWLACRLIEEVSDDATGYATLDLFARRCAPALAADEIERIWQSARNTTSYDPSKAASAPPAPMNLPRPAAPALNGHGPPDTPPTGKATAEAKSHEDRSTKDRPTVRVDAPVHLVADALIAALDTANTPQPTIFQRGRQLVRVVFSCSGGPPVPLIDALTVDSLRPIVGTVAHLVKYNTKVKGDVTADATREQLAAVLTAPAWPFPVLAGISEVPFVRPDGTLHLTPGYDPATGLLYAPAPGLTIPPVPDLPDAGAIAAARTQVLELLTDFPFTTDSERANALALFFLPFVQALIAEPTPLHVVEAPAAGTGKSVLVEMCLYPAIGDRLNADTPKADDTEISKWLASKALAQSPACWLDNLPFGLNSPVLAGAITAGRWSVRLLGGNDLLEMRYRPVYVLTANNPVFTEEVIRRCVRIRLDSNTDRPAQRTNWRHKDFRAWLQTSRGALIGAALTILRGWERAGQPRADLFFGSFQTYAAVLGGILTYLDVPGFLANLAELYEVADPDSAQWAELVDRWHPHPELGRKPVGTSDLYRLATEIPAFDLGNADRSAQTRFGKALSKQRDRIYNGWKITSMGTRNRAALWQLLPVSDEAYEHMNIYEDSVTQNTGNARSNMDSTHGAMGDVHKCSYVHTDKATDLICPIPGCGETTWPDHTGTHAICPQHGEVS